MTGVRRGLWGSPPVAATRRCPPQPQANRPATKRRTSMRRARHPRTATTGLIDESITLALVCVTAFCVAAPALGEPVAGMAVGDETAVPGATDGGVGEDVGGLSDDSESFDDEAFEDEASFGDVENIRVSGRRREELLQEVPISIRAFDTNELNARQITRVDEIGFGTANLTFDAAPRAATATPGSTSAASGRTTRGRSSTPGSASTSTTSTSPAPSTRSSTSSTSSASRCCAGRRARSTARTRSAA